MKTIEINKGGFGIASIFEKSSTKEKLIETGRKSPLFSGNYLDELGIAYNIGDEFKIMSPGFYGGFTEHRIKVHNITDDKYECEFI